MNHITSYPAWAEYKKEINCIVEIPKGTRVKYEVEPNNGEIVVPVRELDRRFVYPYNYGFIPNTLEEDNDPVDVCIIGCDRLEPLTHVKCRVIGCFKTVDNGEQDNKIIAVPTYVDSKIHGGKVARDIRRFLKRYKYPYQKGTVVDKVFYSADVAYELIDAAIRKASEARMYSKVTVE